MRSTSLSIFSLSVALAMTLGLPSPSAAQSAAPTISSFICPLNIEYGNFECEVSYASVLPATVTWSTAGRVRNSAGFSSLLARCSIGRPFRVTVTVTNAYGSTSRSSTFNCV
jgi:hypothetical protein